MTSVTLYMCFYVYFVPLVGYILNIDTSVSGASICIARDGIPVEKAALTDSRDSGAWLHGAIGSLVRQCGIGWQQLDAVAVASGPGSYTGLRVGMAAAKGLAYALGIPVIPVNTLKMMAFGARHLGTMLCPMIDARRMEVFTAVYDPDLTVIMAPTNLILAENSFEDVLQQGIVSFFGNGSEKFSPLNKHSNARFVQLSATAENMSVISYESHLAGSPANIAYLEPEYGKEFYSPVTKDISY